MSLGVPTIRTFLKATIPLLFPALLSGAAPSRMTSSGELGPSILLHSARWATMSVAIFTVMFRNHLGTAWASSLIVAAFAALFVSHRLPGERAALGM